MHCTLSNTSGLKLTSPVSSAPQGAVPKAVSPSGNASAPSLNRATSFPKRSRTPSTQSLHHSQAGLNGFASCSHDINAAKLQKEGQRQRIKRTYESLHSFPVPSGKSRHFRDSVSLRVGGHGLHSSRLASERINSGLPLGAAGADFHAFAFGSGASLFQFGQLVIQGTVLRHGAALAIVGRTNRVIWFGRSFLENNDPKPVAETIKKFTKVYPYEAGGVGTPIADFLSGKSKLGKVTPPLPTVFHEGTGKVMNTIPPNDFSYYEMLNEVVQQEPATSLDPELMGPVAAIGIIKGKPFAPDARMKKILTEALALANANSRTLFMAPRDPDWYYYPGSGWQNLLFANGYEFETPIPTITPEGVKPFPPTGYRQLSARTSYFYGVTGITPAMAMRLTGIGSTYVWTMVDANKQPFDGAKTYKATLPKGIPEANFWSFTLYDNMSRSMLDTPQRYPRAGSQSYPSPAAEANADGSTTVYFGPTQPAGIKRGNWIQTDPKKGWFTILRLYSPLEPFFARTWRPSEVEEISQAGGRALQ